MKKSLLPLFALGACAAGVIPAHAQTWNVATGGNWDLSTNWTPATVPNAIDADARITNLTAAGAYTISASSAQTFTVGRLDFGANSASTDLDMTLGSNVGLIFDVSSGSAQLNLRTGDTIGSTLVIQSAIQLNDNLTSTSTRTGTQITSQFTGAINLQGNTWTVGSMNQGLRFDGAISGTGGSFAFSLDHGSVRDTNFRNTASTFTGGVLIGRNNRVALGDGANSFTGTGGGGILGTGTITVSSNSTTNDGNAATLQSNGANPVNDADAATNVLANNIDVASGRVLRVEASRVINYTGALSGSGTIVKVGGANTGSRALALNGANTGFTGTVEVQDGQLSTRVNDALGSGATIRINPTSNTNGVGLFGSTAQGTDVTIASTLVFQRTASGNSQFITTSGNSTYTLSGNFSNAGTGTAGYIGLGRGNGNLTNTGGGWAVGNNTGTATIRLTGTGTLENNIGIVDGSTTQSVLSLGNTSGTQTFSGNVSGNGALVRNGVGGTTVLSGTNTYSDTTTVTAGTLLVNGSHTGGGNYSVTGVLGGSGTITPAAAATFTVNSGGSLAPGASAGAIGNLTFDGTTRTGAVATFASGSTFTFDLNATSVTGDKITLANGASGDLVFNGNVINFTVAGTLLDGQTYILFDGTNSNQFSGLTVNGSNRITAGLSFAGLGGFYQSDSYLTLVGGDVILNIVAVPEPSEYAIAIGAFMVVIVMIRRRRFAGA